MRFSRPSTGTILGAIAVFIALGGTAAAAATVVNIADPTTPARIAHVNSSGRLETAGSDSVTNTVSTQLAAPSTYVHAGAAVIGSSCVQVAASPAGKAMIVRVMRINVFQDPSPGSGQNITIFGSPNCSPPQVGQVNPATIGETTLPFDPGLGVPAGSGLSAFVGGSVGANVYTDGYSVASGQVPATRVTAMGSKARQHQQ